MSCYFCGGGDQWIKTCRLEDERVRVCDECWKLTRLPITRGHADVTARCSGCGRYFNPREMGELVVGAGKKDLGGLCRSCVR